MLKYELHQSQIYVELPCPITEEEHEKLGSELSKDQFYIDNMWAITDITPYGEFLGGKTESIKLEIDNRYVTNEEAVALIERVFQNCK